MAMENAGDWEKKHLIKELMQGQDLAMQLQLHLKSSPPPEPLGMLAQRILDCFRKAHSMLNYSESDGEQQQANGLNGSMDSPLSAVSGSPRSDNYQERREMCKKRKTLPKWKERIHVSSSTGMEAPMDDGYSWRKYGQKDILGAKHPRGYYRCTHRNAQGCQATKQVQRSDEDTAIFEVTYRGKHTCFQSVHAIKASSCSPPKEDDRKQILLNFRTGLKVKTENMNENRTLNSPSSFSFPSASMESIKAEGQIFSPSAVENPFIGSFSPTFISPATSESNYFSVSPTCFKGGPNSESDHTEIISASTSVTNSPMLDLDFSLDSVLNPDFCFDDSFFS